LVGLDGVVGYFWFDGLLCVVCFELFYEV